MRAENESASKNLKHLEFLNEFIGFSLNNEHFQERAIFPIIFDVKNAKEKEKAQENYNFYGMILNYEQHVQYVHQRYQRLQSEIDETNLTSVFLSEEDREAIKEELGQLESEIELMGPPLDQPFIENLLQENRLASLLEISLSSEQKKGMIPYPVMGQDIPAPEISSKMSYVAHPLRIKEYNRFAEDINTRRSYRDKKLELLELHRKWSEKDWSESLEELPLVQPYFDRLEEQIGAIEKTNPYINSVKDRYTYQRIAVLLFYAEAYGIAKLNRKQKFGEADLPLIEVNELPIPDPEIVEKEFKKLNPDQISRVVESWPIHWRKRLMKAVQSEE